MTLAVGQIVQLNDDIDLFPTILCKRGHIGIIASMDDNIIMVLMFNHFPELDEWNNELEIWREWYEDALIILKPALEGSTMTYTPGPLFPIKGMPHFATPTKKQLRLLDAAPDMLHTLYDVKFTLESVKPSTTVGELLDLWEIVDAVINKAEGR